MRKIISKGINCSDGFGLRRIRPHTVKNCLNTSESCPRINDCRIEPQDMFHIFLLMGQCPSVYTAYLTSARYAPSASAAEGTISDAF